MQYSASWVAKLLWHLALAVLWGHAGGEDVPPYIERKLMPIRHRCKARLFAGTVSWLLILFSLMKTAA